MATANKITNKNFVPSNKEIWPVYAQRFNELVDVINEIEPSDGNLTASGTLTVGGPVILSGTTTSTGAGAVGITGSIHEITTTGTGDALTLADGAEGQRLVVVYVDEGVGGTDTAILTPSNFGGGSTITFNSVGDTADLVFTNGNWYMLGGTGVVA